MTRRGLFQVGLPALGLALWGCGSGDSTTFSSGASGSTNPVATRILRSERDSSFFFGSGGELFQINQLSAEVQKFSAAGQSLWIARLKGRGNNQMDTPVAGATDGQGRAWLVDRALGRLQLLDSAGQPVGNVNAPQPLLRPQDIAIGSQFVYVSDGYQHRIAVFDLNGQFVASWTVGNTLNYPRGLALDPSNRLHVADAGDGRILILDGNGQLITQYGQDLLLHPRGLSIHSSGIIAVADSLARAIFLFAPDLTLLARLEPTSGGQPLTPLDVQFAPDGVLYLTAEPAGVV